MKFEPARVGEVTHYVANIGKARALLGYAPKTRLREGIHQAVAWSVKWWEDHARVVVTRRVSVLNSAVSTVKGMIYRKFG